MHHPPPVEIARQILIPWDGSIPLNQVLTFAQVLGGQDTRLTVLPLAPGCTTGHTASDNSLADRSGQGAMLPSFEVLNLPNATATPALEIIQIANTHEIRLILLATRCHPGGHLDPSCLAAQIALDSPIPVMVIRADSDELAASPQPFTRLVVPLDGSARATQALPLTADLARRLHLPVQLLMVIDPRQVLPPAYAYDPDAAAEMVAGLTHNAHWALERAEQILARQGVTANADLVYGPVVSSLEAAVQPRDLVVMTTHGVGGASRGRLGSIAARIVADARGPFIIMRSTPPADVVTHAFTELADQYRERQIWIG